MIIEAEAKVELDKYELESAQALIRKFVEQKHIVTSVELASMDEHLRSWDGVMLGVERVGLRVKIVAHGKAGAKAIAELLESLGARSDALGGDVIGIDDSACEPSASDRLFYKPRTIVLPNGEVRHFLPPNPPFEPCPAADDRGYGGMIIKATHPKRPSEPAKEANHNHIDERNHQAFTDAKCAELRQRIADIEAENCELSDPWKT